AILIEMDQQATRSRPAFQSKLAQTLATEVGLGADRQNLPLRFPWWNYRQERLQLLDQLYALRGLEADLNVVLAMLALEWGEPRRAEASLERTRALSGKGGEAEEDCYSRHIAVLFMERIRAARKAH